MGKGAEIVAESDPDYLTPETLAAYFAASVPTRQAMGTSPRCWLRIDPSHERLSLYAPFDGDMPDLVEYERLELVIIDLDDGRYFELQVQAKGLHYEAYSLLASIVDALRTGSSFSDATSSAMISFRDLLSGRSRLSRESEEGLVGELFVLRHLVEVGREREALTAWLGPGREEHDFIFSDFDLEVKTTSLERRSHVISSANQLLPSPGRPLWLMSIQLTRAGASKASFSLAALVGELRALITNGRDDFLTRIGSLGWRDMDSELYTTRYILRSTPAAYRVDETFPAVTRPRLNAVVPQPELVGSISYRVDVSSLRSEVPPEPLSGIVIENKGN